VGEPPFLLMCACDNFIHMKSGCIRGKKEKGYFLSTSKEKHCKEGSLCDETVVKGTSFVLVHTPNIMTEAGTTFTLEKAENKNTEFLQRAPEFVRSYEQCVGYPPNQVFIGTWILKSLKTFLNRGTSI